MTRVLDDGALTLRNWNQTYTVLRKPRVAMRSGDKPTDSIILKMVRRVVSDEFRSQRICVIPPMIRADHTNEDQTFDHNKLMESSPIDRIAKKIQPALRVAPCLRTRTMERSRIGT